MIFFDLLHIENHFGCNKFKIKYIFQKKKKIKQLYRVFGILSLHLLGTVVMFRK